MNIKKEDYEEILNLIDKQMCTILLVDIDGKYRPVKNTTKEECYQILGNIQELLQSHKVVFIERKFNEY